jgi:hypothetical protein
MDVVSAEVVEETKRRKGSYTISYACVLKRRQGAPLEIITGADREQAAWLARYLAGRIYLRR